MDSDRSGHRSLLVLSFERGDGIQPKGYELSPGAKNSTRHAAAYM